MKYVHFRFASAPFRLFFSVSLRARARFKLTSRGALAFPATASPLWGHSRTNFPSCRGVLDYRGGRGKLSPKVTYETMAVALSLVPLSAGAACLFGSPNFTLFVFACPALRSEARAELHRRPFFGPDLWLCALISVALLCAFFGAALTKRATSASARANRPQNDTAPCGGRRLDQYPIRGRQHYVASFTLLVGHTHAHVEVLPFGF
jgi:hypothetical protein